MTPGDELVLNIESITMQGEGVARHGGMVFFVENALSGEEVSARVLKVEKNLARAKTTAVLKTSPDRVSPPCPHFGWCGGCSFQHLRYEAQLKEKEQALLGMFKHLGKLNEVRINPAIASPKPYHYRNTIALTVRHQAGRAYPGFIANDNRSFIPIIECPIADERINSALKSVIGRFHATLPKRKQQRISQMVVRVDTDGNVRTSIPGEPPGMLKSRIDGKMFTYTVSSFFQINHFILEAFTRTVGRLLAPEEPANGRLLLDLYCGVGLFAVLFADRYESAVGIEEGKSAVRSARENAALNRMTNTQFIAGRAEELLTAQDFKRYGSRDIVLDPPRTGLQQQVITAIMKMDNVRRMVYVSCNPAVLIRDIALFAPRFRIAEIQPIDMFPQTKHLEVVTLLMPR